MNAYELKKNIESKTFSFFSEHPLTPVERLEYAVAEQAVHDYYSALKLNKTEDISELETYFKSKNFQKLVPIRGGDVIKIIRKRVNA